MPVVQRFNGRHIVAEYVPPIVETRSDALAAEVDRGSVDLELVIRTERTVRMAARTLGLDPEPRLRWLPADVKNIRGVVFDEVLSEVWVRVQAPDKTKETALHELKHVHQLRGDRYRTLGLDTYESRQRDADEFAATWSPWDAPIQERGRRLWEERYAPIQQAARQHVYERQDFHSAGGRRSASYAVKVIR